MRFRRGDGLDLLPVAAIKTSHRCHGLGQQSLTPQLPRPWCGQGWFLLGDNPLQAPSLLVVAVCWPPSLFLAWRRSTLMVALCDSVPLLS